jgi:hypothetical protein
VAALEDVAKELEGWALELGSELGGDRGEVEVWEVDKASESEEDVVEANGPVRAREGKLGLVE